jgi:glycosyltransferase involved in cell wall biosynthesis
VGEILITIPEILANIPRSRFIFVGFGSYREHLEAMIKALGSGDQSTFTACARAGEFIEDVDVTRRFRKLGPEEINRITVTGILDHECLGELLPLASLTLVPSKWPEAFGMVAVESMSAGVMPLCNDYAGLRDVIREVETVAPDLAEMMKLDREKFVDQLPEKIQNALHYLYPDGFDHLSRRQNVGKTLRQIAVEKFSWDGIARRLLA